MDYGGSLLYYIFIHYMFILICLVLTKNVYVIICLRLAVVCRGHCALIDWSDVSLCINRLSTQQGICSAPSGLIENCLRFRFQSMGTIFWMTWGKMWRNQLDLMVSCVFGPAQVMSQTHRSRTSAHTLRHEHVQNALRTKAFWIECQFISVFSGFAALW